ncbi:mechanosensitive ion channel [Alloacidobacterium dinghuense]|uniref:Mechanosensitive ion channel n=1 Tax=Alloacidobacterium dinghuense TaxID=2763107 RepID=A0A7G8BF07_9BACT|nr:mechanosensitive ion channel domain-containing protein [Alloacidobacterium dinghuense]QNI31127.1 mechanosensitive ion channel [Alloacidobacterium dinghuense]
MKRLIINVCVGLIICQLPAASPLSAMAQQQLTTPTNNQVASEQDIIEEEVAKTGEVVIDGRPVLTVYERIAHLTPEARAQGIEARIITLARETSIPPESVLIQPRDVWTEISADNVVIMAVTDADARAAGKSRQILALEDAASIRQTIQTYRQEHSWRMILRAIFKTALAVLFLVLSLWLVRRCRWFLRVRIEEHIRRSAKVLEKSGWHLSFAYIGPTMLAIGTFLRWLLILGLCEATLTIVLGFFSSTREISLTVTRWVFSQLEMLGRSVVDYLPKLLVVAVIAIITNYALRLVRLIFRQIRRGELKIPGFYPDWAEPTEKLIRLLLLVLALIVAFPYLPGARSPAFRGISIFVGVLLSLGSSSAVASAIAGVILTYMRSFLVGDWVQIGDTMGEVIEKTLLVTRLLTPKAEVITIPNSAVMNGSVKNYSTEAKRAGVIFYTAVSIGFDAPWRTVHQLLVGAALATEHVLRQPAPFVLQRSLDDFYVTYELNAYTDTPREVLNIYSDLHRNIQDKFNDAGVEICSPHFSSLRDGNTIAIPEQYIKPDYKQTGFRVNLGEIARNGDSQTKCAATSGDK